VSPESTDPSEPTSTPKSRAAQDKKLINDSGAAGQTIRAVMADTEAAAELTAGGYPPEELSRGLGLQKTLEDDLAERQAADGAETAANRAYKSADRALHTTYSTVRGLSRSAFLKDPAALETLGLAGREPRDMEQIMGAVDRLLKNAPLPDYAAKLTRRGVTAAKLQGLQAKLEALQEADRVQEAAKSATPKVTARRDAAAKVLFDWLVEFKAFARAQFKDRPDILKRWGI